jgi:hypothetical protein
MQALTTTYARRSQGVFTPVAGVEQLYIGAAAGSVVWFILPQLEEGTFADSVIVNTGAANTRAVDLPIYSGLSRVLANPFTLVVEGDAPNAVPTGSQQTMAQLSGASLTDRVEIYRNTGSAQILTLVQVGGATQAVLAPTAPSYGAFKAAVRIQADNMNMAVNGAIATADTSALVPSLTKLAVGVSADGTVSSNADIGRVRILPYAATDAQLQALTT